MLGSEQAEHTGVAMLVSDAAHRSYFGVAKQPSDRHIAKVLAKSIAVVIGVSVELRAATEA